MVHWHGIRGVIGKKMFPILWYPTEYSVNDALDLFIHQQWHHGDADNVVTNCFSIFECAALALWVFRIYRLEVARDWVVDPC